MFTKHVQTVNPGEAGVGSGIGNCIGCLHSAQIVA